MKVCVAEILLDPPLAVIDCDPVPALAGTVTFCANPPAASVCTVASSGPTSLRAHQDLVAAFPSPPREPIELTNLVLLFPVAPRETRESDGSITLFAVVPVATHPVAFVAFENRDHS